MGDSFVADTFFVEFKKVVGDMRCVLLLEVRWNAIHTW
jgi:hypothetical protein